MESPDYKFIISPENVKSDLTFVGFTGETDITNFIDPCCLTNSTQTLSDIGQTGVYLPMSYILSGNTGGTSFLTGLSVNIMITESAVDIGYYSPFDGMIIQADVLNNFIATADTINPYTYVFYNTSDLELIKFLSLVTFTLDWGDGSPIQVVLGITPITHTYPTAQNNYTITLTANSPWGISKVQKPILTPFTNSTITNPQGSITFFSASGSWTGTPVSYDYIFSGDAVNVVSAQTSNNYLNVPFIISGITTSRVTELSLYGNPKYQVGVPVIKNGQIWGSITNMDLVYTAYTITGINFYDYADGTSIFFQESSGFTDSNLTAVPITKLESLLKVMDQPQIQTDVFLERGKNSAYERVQRLGEIDNLGDLLNYGYGFFNVQKAP